MWKNIKLKEVYFTSVIIWQIVSPLNMSGMHTFLAVLQMSSLSKVFRIVQKLNNFIKTLLEPFSSTAFISFYSQYGNCLVYNQVYSLKQQRTLFNLKRIMLIKKHTHIKDTRMQILSNHRITVTVHMSIKGGVDWDSTFQFKKKNNFEF